MGAFKMGGRRAHRRMGDGLYILGPSNCEWNTFKADPLEWPIGTARVVASAHDTRGSTAGKLGGNGRACLDVGVYICTRKRKGFPGEAIKLRGLSFNQSSLFPLTIYLTKHLH